MALPVMLCSGDSAEYGSFSLWENQFASQHRACILTNFTTKRPMLSSCTTKHVAAQLALPGSSAISKEEESNTLDNRGYQIIGLAYIFVALAQGSGLQEGLAVTSIINSDVAEVSEPIARCIPHQASTPSLHAIKT